MLNRCLYLRDVGIRKISVLGAIPLSKNANSGDIRKKDSCTGCANRSHFSGRIQDPYCAPCRVSGINVGFRSSEKLIWRDVVDSAVDAIISFVFCFSSVASISNHRFPEVASLFPFVLDFVRVPLV